MARRKGKRGSGTPPKRRSGRGGRGKQPKPKQPRAQTTTTRATKLHAEARSRAQALKKELRAQLRKTKAKGKRKELRALLTQVKQFEAQQKEERRSAAPVGSASAGRVAYLDQPTSARSYSEVRWFATGGQLLGYLEGRPGAATLLAVEGGPRPPGAQVQPAKLDPAVQARIAALPMVQAATGARQAQLEAWVAATWLECEEWGAEVETEIVYG